MKKTIKLGYFEIIWTIGFLFFFRPAPYVIGNSVSKILNIVHLGFCVVLIAVACYEYEKRGYRMKPAVICSALLYFWCLAGASLFSAVGGHPVDWEDVLKYFSQALSFIILTDLGLSKAPRKTLSCFLNVGIFMTTLNAFTFFIYFSSGGMNPNMKEMMNGKIIELTYFLLERDNATYFWSWPVIIVTWYYYYKFQYTKWFRNLALAYTALITASYIYVWSVLAFVACVFVPVLLLVLHKSTIKEMNTRHQKRFGFIRLEYLWIAAVAFCVFLTISYKLPFIQHVIQDYFHKDATLSGRSFIWARAYRWFKTAPIIGFGCEPAKVSVSKLSINHCHNLFLETIYRGGIIGLALFALLFIVLAYTTRKSSKCMMYKYFVTLLTAFLLFSSVEFAYYRYHYLIIIIIMAHTELLQNTYTDRVTNAVLSRLGAAK